jgi:hypothetical protein
MVIKGKIPKRKTGKQYECENRNIGKMLSDAQSRNDSLKLLGDHFNEPGEGGTVRRDSGQLTWARVPTQLEKISTPVTVVSNDTSKRSPMYVLIEQIATQPC